ncbi:MAG: hypothetical protein LCH73_16075 [Proteobacteria bacterium]|nr:hypothetical protein [Pseudomonadota bacterium]
MMLMKTVFVLIALAVAAPVAMAAEVPDALVASTLGVSGVKHTTKVANKYGVSYSDVTYVDGQGQAMIVIRHADPAQFSLWKQAGGNAIASVAGVGAEAFQYKMIGGVCARSVTHAACVTDLLGKGVPFSQAQLLTLLKAAL